MPAIHESKRPFAGRSVRIASGEFSGQIYRVEDWWDRVSGGSWKWMRGNAACLNYAVRAVDCLPTDDEVVYGKINSLGHLIHVSELGEPISEAA